MHLINIYISFLQLFRFQTLHRHFLLSKVTPTIGINGGLYTQVSQFQVSYTVLIT